MSTNQNMTLYCHPSSDFMKWRTFYIFETRAQVKLEKIVVQNDYAHGSIVCTFNHCTLHNTWLERSKPKAYNTQYNTHFGTNRHWGSHCSCQAPCASKCQWCIFTNNINKQNEYQCLSRLHWRECRAHSSLSWTSVFYPHFTKLEDRVTSFLLRNTLLPQTTHCACNTNMFSTRDMTICLRFVRNFIWFRNHAYV